MSEDNRPKCPFGYGSLVDTSGSQKQPSLNPPASRINYAYPRRALEISLIAIFLAWAVDWQEPLKAKLTIAAYCTLAISILWSAGAVLYNSYLDYKNS